MLWGDIELKEDATGDEYLEFTESHQDKKWRKQIIPNKNG
jgi:hypothetical protein